MCIDQYEAYMKANDLGGAALVAANSPLELFRKQEAIKRLYDHAKKVKGGSLFGHPLIVYFNALLKHSTELNESESIEYL